MTERVGIIGYPVGHSLSPAIFTWLFAQEGRDGIYEAWDTPPDSLVECLDCVKNDASIKGANVTLPYKVAVAQLVGAADTKHTGAINCLYKDAAGRIAGTNTDVAGLLDAMDTLEASRSLRGKNVVVLGAGGVARAALAACHQREPARVTVLARETQRAQPLLRLWRGLARAHADVRPAPIVAAQWKARTAALAHCDLLINATSGGMAGKPPLHIDVGELPEQAVVMDLVYVPLQTPLLRAAARRGLATIDGLHMLIAQAIANYRRWFGDAAVVAIGRRLAAAEKTAKKITSRKDNEDDTHTLLARQLYAFCKQELANR